MPTNCCLFLLQNKQQFFGMLDLPALQLGKDTGKPPGVPSPTPPVPARGERYPWQ